MMGAFDARPSTTCSLVCHNLPDFFLSSSSQKTSLSLCGSWVVDEVEEE